MTYTYSMNAKNPVSQKDAMQVVLDAVYRSWTDMVKETIRKANPIEFLVYKNKESSLEPVDLNSVIKVVIGDEFVSFFHNSHHLIANEVMVALRAAGK